MNVPTRCFLEPCLLPGTFKNPLCSADTYAAYSSPAEAWCPQCTECSSTQFEERDCRASHPEDEAAVEGALYSDRVCQDCTVCGYDEYVHEECGERTDTVCRSRVFESVRRSDGSTGARGRLYSGFTGSCRNPNGDVELEFRYSDRRQDDDAPSWFRIDETRRSGIRFTYVFRSSNHRETRLILGQFPNQDIRFRLSYLSINTRQGETMPADRPANDDPRWRSSNQVDVRTCVIEILAPAAPIGPPERAVRSTGYRGRLENAFDQQQRAANCDVLVDVRYVCSSLGSPGTVCAEEATYRIREVRRSGIRFSRSIVMARDTEQRFNLGQFPNQDIRFQLDYSDGNGGWRRSNTIDVGTKCLETFEPADVSSRGVSDRETGIRGRISGEFGERRASNGDVMVRVQFKDGDGPE